ncbi:MAG: tetraacyldisaccharide 4'-kinase [Deltaproteobacteria bacterium]|nr:tetraacyldisaccharide 4'-kinase [Deltaproteobacteria bacterium]
MIDWSKIHQIRVFSLATLLLAPCSFLYGLGVRFRLMAYRKRKRKILPGVVISIGNLTTGGTGKTPAACMLAQWALIEGYRVTILSRGYGGRYKGRVLEVSDGNDMKAGPAEAGDEPCLLARKLKGIPVVVAKKRYFAGLYAHERFGTNFFVLDDAFQHLDLRRDLDLVLMDASSPFGNGHLLPWGPLREPRAGLKRADAFLITRSGYDGSADGLMDALKGKWPDKPVFQSDHVPEKIVFPADGAVHNIDFLKGKRVVAFAGMARPEELKKMLTDLGADVVSFKGFEDHHPFQRREIQALMDERINFHADCLLTTEKDWVRMEGIVHLSADLAYLTIQMDMRDEKEAFFRMVREAAVRLEGTAHALSA